MNNFVDTFEDLVITEANSTELPVVPEGEYAAYVKSIKARRQKESTILDVIWVVTDSDVIEALQVEEPIVPQSVFLDMTPEGGLDMSEGKNVSLGLLREAVNQNQAGQPWRFADLIGQSALVSVRHRIWEKRTLSNVKQVAPLD